MKQIILRNIPPDVKKTVQQEAERKGLSLNKAVMSLLEQAVHGKTQARKKKVLYHDLDHLAGMWSCEEAAEFDKSLKTRRKVDAESWKKTK